MKNPLGIIHLIKYNNQRNRKINPEKNNICQGAVYQRRNPIQVGFKLYDAQTRNINKEILSPSELREEKPATIGSRNSWLIINSSSECNTLIMCDIWLAALIVDVGLDRLAGLVLPGTAIVPWGTVSTPLLPPSRQYTLQPYDTSAVSWRQVMCRPRI